MALFQGHVNLSVADPDLQIRRGGSHPDPGIWGGGGGSPKIFFRPQFGTKIRGRAPFVPSPESATAFCWNFTLTGP